MYLASSAPDLPNIFQKGLIDGLINGAIFFIRIAWPYILFFIALGIISRLVSRKKK